VSAQRSATSTMRRRFFASLRAVSSSLRGKSVLHATRRRSGNGFSPTLSSVVPALVGASSCALAPAAPWTRSQAKRLLAPRPPLTPPPALRSGAFRTAMRSTRGAPGCRRSLSSHGQRTLYICLEAGEKLYA
jgi:hypothetical protein